MRNYLRDTFSVVLLLGVALSGFAATLGPQASANGHGTLLVLDEDGNTVRRQFSFSARQLDAVEYTAQGQAVLHNPAFRVDNGQKYSLHIDVTCMRVYGNIAVMGGYTRRTNDPNLVDAVYFSVQDNGEPGKGNDRISRAFFFDDDPTTEGDPALCALTGPTDFPLEPIAAGNVQVR